MLRIFRHYIPTTLLLLGLAEALILVVSIYVGVALGVALEGLSLGGAGLSVLIQAMVFCGAMLAGMIAILAARIS